MTNRTYETMIAELLKHDQTQVDAYFAVQHQQISKSVTLMESRLSRQQFLEYAWAAERTASPTPYITDSTTYIISREQTNVGLGKHRLHTTWCVYMQEVAASIPASVLHIPDGGIALDMCAAPGGKSVQMADSLLSGAHPGIVISNEINSTRMITLQSNLNRMGAYNTAVTNISWEKRAALLPNMCDAVLIDAPCSGEGTGFKSDAGTKRRRLQTILEISHLQQSLLVSGIHACKPGGSIVYATCTINPRENEMVVAHALAVFGDTIELLPTGIHQWSPGITTREGKQILSETDSTSVTRFRPHVQHTGWFFIAHFRKLTESKTGSGSDEIVAISSKIPLQSSRRQASRSGSQLDISPNLQSQIAQRLLDEFGIQIDPSRHFFLATPKQVYLTTPTYRDLHNHLPLQKTGVPIYKKDEKGNLRPLHGLGQTLWTYAQKNTLTLNDEQLAHYASGADLDRPLEATDTNTDNTSRGYKIILYNKKGISVWKLIPGTLKNKFLKLN